MLENQYLLLITYYFRTAALDNFTAALLSLTFLLNLRFKDEINLLKRLKRHSEGNFIISGRQKNHLNNTHIPHVKI